MRLSERLTMVHRECYSAYIFTRYAKSGPVMDPDLVKSRVQRAVNRLADLDEFLLVNDVHEQAVSHKLGMYLDQEFPLWDVDCEYNRQDLEDPKELVGYSSETVRPDVIVHERGPEGTTGENLLIVEIKTNYTNEELDDIDKIEAFLGEKNYQCGIFIDFRKDRSDWLNWVQC